MRSGPCVLALAAVLALLLSSGAGVAFRPVAGAPAPSVPGPDFAVRAGYSPSWPSLTEGVHPAEGVRTVDVVFRPSGTPSPGATTSPHSAWSQSEYADRFGAPLSVLRAAQSYFGGYGLSALSLGADRLVLELSGPPSAFDRAFGTALEAGSHLGHPVVFPARPPTLPGWLEPNVAAVVGLESGFDAFSVAVHPLAHSSAPFVLSPSLTTPGRAREIYGFSQLYNLTGGPANATGQTIALVLWGAGYAPSDLSAFFTQDYPTSFPAPRVRALPVDGAPAPSNAALSVPAGPQLQAVEELTLDIEWAASMAPGATIDAVYAGYGPGPSYSPSTANLTTALETALAQPNVSAVSMSFGSPESTDTAVIAAWSPLFSEAAQRGITMLAATGDTGGDTTACSGSPAPEFPSSSPQVLAVGGTNVTFPGPGTFSFTESGWAKGGGGFSTTFAAPSWQLVGSAQGPIAANGHRGMPDVSASAADNFLYFNGGPGAAAGTSFASPLWAGLVADFDAKWGQRFGFFTDRLYHVAANETPGAPTDGLVDVTSGGNCVANAGTGWDASTGWGSPRAAVLFVELRGSFVNLTLDVRPAPAAPGGAVTVRVLLTNRTTGSPIAGVPVQLGLAADVPTGPCSGGFGSRSPTTDTNGTAEATFTVPFCYLGPHAVASAFVGTVQYYGKSSVRIGVNLLGWFPKLAFLSEPPWSYATYTAIVGSALGLGWALGRSVPAFGPPPIPPASPAAPTPAPPDGPAPAMAAPGPEPSTPAASPEGTPPSSGPPASEEATPAEPATEGDAKMPSPSEETSSAPERDANPEPQKS